PSGPAWQPRVTRQKSPHPMKKIDWSRETIYFVLIDRFHNGDPGNDAGHNPASHVPYRPELGNIEALKTYQGGDLKGVIDKLDYLQDLGITTLWLSPVFDNSDSAFVGWYPYHGYHPIDFFEVDEHFGNMALLKKLVRKAHKHGIKVLLDMIFNHTAPDHPYVRDPALWETQGYKYWFHPHSGVDASTSIQDWGDQGQLETRELNGLPDLAQENPHVYNFLLDVSKFWIVETGCDGFRLDAVKHIPRSFWRKICRDLHDFASEDFLLLGEVFAGETDYVAGYQDLGFNALFDIPMYYTINRVLAQGGRMQQLSLQMERNEASYHQVILSPLIDNHDVARFSYWAGSDAKEKIRQSITFLLTLPGLPMLYYGTEVALPGAAPTHEQTGEGQDYLNRLMLPWNRIEGEDADLARHITSLLHLRRDWPALRNDSRVECYKDYSIYAYLKYDRRRTVFVLLSNSSEPELRRIPLPQGVFPDNFILIDQLSGKIYRVQGDSLRVSFAPLASYLLSGGGGRFNCKLSRAPRYCPFSPVISSDMRWVDFFYQGDGDIQSVTIAGDFNGWSASADSLHRTAGGQWRVKLPLKRGRYRYKFVIDGRRWIADERAKESELDPYGSRNSVVVVE
ncbi:hypothetical protein JXO59_02690, partial [candidate division KSB1 bacterium]|nr:hypothetical protein [candidate division KSB1 bacterium]